MSTITFGTGFTIETFTATETWVCPSVAVNGYDVTSLLTIECRGFGGVGGAGSTVVGGGGGSGGAYALKNTSPLTVTPGTSYFVHCQSGADVWFNTTNVSPSSTTTGCMAKSGTNGTAANVSTVGTGATAPAASASVGDVTHAGGSGANGNGVTGGGGGGGAGDSANGSSTTVQNGGAGGSVGGGPGGKGGDSVTAGASGASYGGAGAGGGAAAGTTAGAGATGRVVITYIRRFGRTASETISLTDTATRGVVLTRTPPDTASVTSSAATRILNLFRTGAETAAAVDTAGRGVAISRTMAETATAADAATRRVVNGRNLSDTATTGDAASRQAAFARTGAETTTLTDAATRTASYTRGGTETATASETATRHVVLSRALPPDSAPAVESAVRVEQLNRTATENLGGTTPDYPVVHPTKAIAGTVRLDSDGSAYLGGATVRLIRDSDDVRVQTVTSSTVDGTYTFPRDTTDPYTYHCEFDGLDGGGGPIFAKTQRGLAPQ